MSGAASTAPTTARPMRPAAPETQTSITRHEPTAGTVGLAGATDPGPARPIDLERGAPHPGRRRPVPDARPAAASARACARWSRRCAPDVVVTSDLARARETAAAARAGGGDARPALARGGPGHVDRADHRRAWIPASRRALERWRRGGRTPRTARRGTRSGSGCGAAVAELAGAGAAPAAGRDPRRGDPRRLRAARRAGPRPRRPASPTPRSASSTPSPARTCGPTGWRPEGRGGARRRAAPAPAR